MSPMSEGGQLMSPMSEGGSANVTCLREDQLMSPV